MSKAREILDEVFCLMEQQSLESTVTARQTEEYRQRAERINKLLDLLIHERPRPHSWRGETSK